MSSALLAGFNGAVRPRKPAPIPPSPISEPSALPDTSDFESDTSSAATDASCDFVKAGMIEGCEYLSAVVVYRDKDAEALD